MNSLLSNNINSNNILIDVGKNQIITIIICLVGGIMSSYRFVEFQPNTQIVIVFLGGLSIFYPFGLRTIPYIKIFLIAAIWTSSTMFLLLLENNQLINQNIILHLFTRFLFVFAICIPFDIRDIKYDNIKLKTIPIVFGVSKSKLILSKLTGNNVDKYWKDSTDHDGINLAILWAK